MAGWIKSKRQQDGSFCIAILREVAGTDGTTELMECADIITRASPLEFANAILRAHGVEPAHVFAVYAKPLVERITADAQARGEYDPHPNTLPNPNYVHHAAIAPMPAHEAVIAQTEEALREALGIDDEEPPLRACANGGCGE